MDGNSKRQTEAISPEGKATDLNSKEPAPAATERKTNVSSNDGDQATKVAKAGTQEKPSKPEDQPVGGFDDTPIPYAQPGYTLKITIHRAENLPAADINTLSSDPYVIAQLYTANQTRHKEDPPLKMRTFTIRRDVNPEWNAEWIVANVPASGFKLKCRIYDEDPGDHDDRLGNVHVDVPSLTKSWPGIAEKSYRVKKRMGSKRAYLIQAMATGVKKRRQMTGVLIISIKMIGRTESSNGGRVYTVGPIRWFKHYSPLLGRIANRKTPGNDSPKDKAKPKSERYNFQANQFQLCGPVPAELYHRYVEFKPFVKRMFTGSGVRGFFLQKALSHQHAQIYHYDRTTEYGNLGEKPSEEVVQKFLELVQFDKGGRIFTYILTLDSLFRFTETGKEFGIDMLSKHTMHSNVSVYTAFSGEFFIRRLKHAHRDPPELGGDNKAHPPHDIKGGPPDEEGPTNPAYYELVIDNDSGTYRPNADLLPKLKEFLAYNFPGLKIVTLDCQKDAELQQKLKDEQRQKKKEEGNEIVYRQIHRSDSVSSSDVSDLEEMAAGGREEPGFLSTMKHDISVRSNMRKLHWKTLARGRTQESVNGGQREQTRIVKAAASGPQNGMDKGKGPMNGVH